MIAKQMHSVMRLADRLQEYSSWAPLKPYASPSRRLANWAVYAAVPAAAAASASNAAAATIQYAGSPVTVTAASNSSSRTVQFGTAPPLHLFAGRFNFSSSDFREKEGIAAAAGVEFLGQNLSIANLGSGKLISSGAGSFQYGHVQLNVRATGSSSVSGRFSQQAGQWIPGIINFAGFRFATNTHSSTAQVRYGWAELRIDMDAEGFPDSVTLLAAAYDDTGAPISTPSGTATPEPATAGLTLLALGAAGVAALRRRRAVVVT